jgi:hypothetical protein
VEHIERCLRCLKRYLRGYSRSIRRGIRDELGEVFEVFEKDLKECLERHSISS